MIDTVYPEIFEKCPDYERAVVVATDVCNDGQSDELLEAFEVVQAMAKQKLPQQNVVRHPYIASWRAAFRELGVNPKQYPPAVASLAKSLHRRSLPFINTLVALFNLISVKYLLPCGGDDIDRVTGDLHLKPANGDELYTPLNSRVVEHPQPGEIIYVDDAGMVLCRRWCWRQGDKTKLTPETRNVAINLDCLPPVTRQEVEVVVNELTELIAKYCGGKTSSYWLDIHNPQAEIWS